ncbi:MAG: hypothetical protein ACK5OC_29390 [Pirellula sp.]
MYQVGELELLVHNACSSTSGNSYFAQFGRLAHQRYMSNLANGIDKVKEFILPSGRRIDFIDTVNGFVYELKPNNPRAIQRGYNQVSSYIAELMSMPEFAHITKWKGIIDVY